MPQGGYRGERQGTCVQNQWREEVLTLIYGGIDEREASYLWGDRMALLLRNRWFMDRIRESRSVLGLPQKGISGLDLRRFPREGTPFEHIPRISRESLGDYWMQVHRAKFIGEPIPIRVLPPGFPCWFHRYLTESSPLCREPSQLPGWMQREPMDIRELLKLQVVPFDDRVPLDKLAALLVEAFQLPWGCFSSLRCFVVTNDTQVLDWEGPLEVQVRGVVHDSRRVLEVTVSGVDAWTTKERWIEIFDRHIRPMQELQWEVLDSPPANRRSRWFPDDSEVKFYDLVRHQGLSYDKALGVMSEVPGWDTISRNKAFNIVKRLDTLMRPMF